MRRPVAVMWLIVSLSTVDAWGADRAKFVIKRNVEYARVGEARLLLDAYVPKRKTPMPGVLVVHGGAWRFADKTELAFYARELAERGFVAFAIDYRLAPTHKFPAQIDDCRSAVRWIRTNAKKYRVDPQRIGGIGYSAGGQLVALSGTTGKAGDAKAGKIDTRLQAVVAGGTPCDFRGVPANAALLSYWLGGTRAQMPQKYRDASPIAFVSKSSPPMFFYHGSNDALVPRSSPQEMVKALKEQKVAAELLVLPRMRHMNAPLSRQARLRSWTFFEKHLKKPSGKRGARR